MLDHALPWMFMADTVLEGLLLFRVLALKLHRIYAFITLYCALNLLFDAVRWWLGWGSQASEMVYLYSLFVFAAVYPLVSWDVFEEIKSQVATIRRLHAPRLVTGIFVSLIILVLFALNVDPPENSPRGTLLATLAIVVWTGSTTTCLGFLWFVRRSIRVQKVGTSNNTFVWMVFFQLSLILSLIDSIAALTATLVKPLTLNIVQTVLISCDIVLTAWCILKLKAFHSDAPPAPQQAPS